MRNNKKETLQRYIKKVLEQVVSIFYNTSIAVKSQNKSPQIVLQCIVILNNNIDKV